MVKGEKKIVKKSQIIWMLNNEKIRVSPDIKMRYIPKKKGELNSIEETQEINGLWRGNTLKKGDYIVVKLPSGYLIKARVVAFKKLDSNSNSTSKSQKSSILHVPGIDIKNSKNVTLILDCCPNIPTTSVNVSQYVCHCKSDINFSSAEVIAEINRVNAEIDQLKE
jgi:hypothetical protein